MTPEALLVWLIIGAAALLLVYVGFKIGNWWGRRRMFMEIYKKTRGER